MRALFPLLPVLIASCTIEEDEFAESYGKTVCSRLHDCQRSDYDDRYEERSECVDEWAELADTFLDIGDTLGQEYSPELAQDCLEAIRAASCSEFSDGQVECQVFVE